LFVFKHSGTDERVGQSRSELPRRDIFIWAAAILFVNQLLVVLKEMPSSSVAKLVSDLCAVGMFQYMAWGVIFRLLSLSSPMPAARLQDFLTATTFCLLILLPVSQTIWVAATGIAVYFWRFNAGDLKLQAAGIVLVALSVQQFWGHFFFDLIALPVLRVETALVGTLLEVTRAGTAWQDNVISGRDSHGIVIYPYCSSFHNLSLALLCWVTVTKFRNQNWARRDFLVGGIVGGTMILFNVARLYLMALDIDLYHYWHEGTGLEIFSVAASVTIILLSLYGSRPAGQQI
jgi:hypothetical protein